MLLEIDRALSRSLVQLITRRPSGRPESAPTGFVAPAELKAWAAGIMEGEGSVMIRLTANTRPQLAVSIANTDVEMLVPFGKYWGASVRKVNAETVKPWHKERHRWGIVSQQAARFLNDIRPYVVTSRMKKRIHCALTFQALKDAWRSRPGFDGDTFTARQMEFYHCMRALNRKGRPFDRAELKPTA